MIDRIKNYFSDAWNFSPRFELPKFLEKEDSWWDQLGCCQADIKRYKKAVFK